MKLMKRFFHLSITVLLVCSMYLSVHASDAVISVSATAENASYLDYLTENQEREKREHDLAHKPDDIVTIIVELEGKPLLDHVKSGSVEAFLKSARSNILETKIEISQDIVISEIESIVEDISIEDRYSTVVNGFSLRTQFENLELIQSVPKVKRAFVAVDYDAVIPLMDDSNESIGAHSVWEDAHLKGEGIVIAVLDTGLDVEHEAFQQELVDNIVSKSDIASILDAKELSAGKRTENLHVDDVYESSKIPFAYDYADRNTFVGAIDAETGHNTAHGTHVAGTVAGKSDTFSGVAPNAQLMIFKVFSDEGGTTHDGIILAALDDAVKLNVDVINMSLGSNGGFSKDSNILTQEVYQRLYDAGIIVDVSAGNSDNAAIRNRWSNLGLTLASNPDHGVVGSPSTYDAPLSIASVDNVKSRMASIESNGRLVQYTTTAHSFRDLDDVEYEYVMIPGVGSSDDYAILTEGGLSLSDYQGKIFIVKRGLISFADKIEQAQLNGAIGILIYNNVSGPLVNMAKTDIDLPAGFISLEDGSFLNDQTTKTLKVSQIDLPFANDETGGKPSSFSSMGTTNELRIKPELSAPGGNIYSTYPSQTGVNYKPMSGTSMAAPHVAGASALVKQHLKSENPDLSDREIVERVNQLLMSTARPVFLGAAPYPVRKQGAGVFNVNDAINSPAFLSVDHNRDGSRRPKLELGDDVARLGSYVLKFSVTNTSLFAVSYDISTVTSLARVAPINFGGEFGTKIFSLNDNRLAETTVSGIQRINLESGQSKEVEVTITLSEGEKHYLETYFDNGGFVEGYVSLNPTTLSGNDVVLSIPFLAYFGDWSQAPIFDSGSWFDRTSFASNVTHRVYTNNTVLGGNVFDLNFDDVNVDMLSISPNDDGFFDRIDDAIISQVRNADNLRYTIRNKKTGEIVYDHRSDYSVKSMYRGNHNRQVASSELNLAPSWDGRDLSGNRVIDGVYEYRIEAGLGYREGIDDVYSFDLSVDTLAPKIENNRFIVVERDDRVFLETRAFDDRYLVHTLVAPVEDDEVLWGEALLRNYTPNEALSEHHISIDVTGKEGETFALSVVDNAMNESVFFVTSPKAVDKTLQFPYEFVRLKVGETLTLSLLENFDNLVWTSDKESIVSVSNDGVLTANSPGQTRVHVRDDRGYRGELLVIVYDETLTSDSLKLSFSSIEVEEGSKGLVSVQNYSLFGETLVGDDVVWTSENEEIIELSGRHGRKVSFTVVGVAGQKTAITARYRGLQESIEILIVPRVEEIASDSVYLTYELGLGEKIELHAVHLHEEIIDWILDDETLLSLHQTEDVNYVSIEGLAVGQTKVYAKSLGFTKIFNISIVENYDRYKDFNFGSPIYHLNLEDEISVHLKYDILTDLDRINIRHFSHDESIARYDGDIIQAIGVGETLIETELDNGVKISARVLVNRINNQNLRALLNQSQMLYINDYSKTSWAKLLLAQQEAVRVLYNINASSFDIQHALSELQFAMDHMNKPVLGLDEAMTVTVGSRFTLNPKPLGGGWRFDSEYLSFSKNDDGSYAVSALKLGSTQIIYYANDEQFMIDVRIIELAHVEKHMPEINPSAQRSRTSLEVVNTNQEASNEVLPDAGVTKPRLFLPSVLVFFGILIVWKYTCDYRRSE